MTMRSAPPPLLVALLGLVIGAGCSPQRDCTARIYHYPHRQVDEVLARGDFDGWAGTPLAEVCPCIWHVDLDLEPGDYLYELEVDGASTLDELVGLTGWDGEDEHSLLRVEDCAAPAWEVIRANASADGRIEVELTFLRASSGADLDEDALMATLRDGTQLDASAVLRGGQVTLTAAGLPPGKHTVTVEVADDDGVAAEPLVLPLWVEDTPFAWNDALIYQVMVDRFATADGPVGDPGAAARGLRHGGDLAGLSRVMELDYFDDLGVNALWISPMVDNPTGAWPGADGHDYEGYHGYWPIDAREVEPDFGSAEDLDTLVAEAHRRGIRVLLDVVPNHVHLEHPYAIDHLDDGWFNGEGDCVCGTEDCPWNEFIETCWFTEYLADLDLRDTDIARLQAQDVAWWIERYDLDGVRVDAVPMMPRSATRELVWEIQRRFERGGADLYVVGETFTGSEGWSSIQRTLGPFGLDGQFDFPVMWTLRDTLAHGNGTMVDLREAIGESEAAWGPPGATMAPFVGNHDVTRFLSEAAGDTGDRWEDPPPAPDDDAPYRSLVLAQTVAMTLPGAPVIYYGDEFGMPGSGDPDNRRPMRFSGQLNDRETWTLDQIARLGRARVCLASLRHGYRHDVFADDHVLAYGLDAGDGHPALVLINRDDDPVTRTYPIPEAMRLREPAFLVDVFSGAEVVVQWGATGYLTLPAQSAMVLVPAASGCSAF